MDHKSLWAHMASTWNDLLDEEFRVGILRLFAFHQRNCIHFSAIRGVSELFVRVYFLQMYYKANECILLNSDPWTRPIQARGVLLSNL
jgi:hypothetical protein